MKIVLDINVFISGIFWKGTPNKVLSLWAQNKIQIITSNKIITEYLRVLHKIDKEGNIAKKWGAFIIENSVIIQNRDLIKTCRDPDDNKFLNCAIIGRADYLVSGDDDLLCLKEISKTKIINPSKFIKLYNNKH